MSKKGLGILISGRGSNMEAIIQAALSKQIDATVNVVISNKNNALGIDSAKSYGIKTFVLEKKDYSSKKEYEEEISQILKDHSVDLVCLAGYMTLVGETLLEAFNNKIINIHPSLLPAFKGLNAQKQALDYGVSYAGCSVHYVDQSMDGGALIMQDIVEVLDTDTEESLSKKILKKEHLLYPKAINLVLKKKS
jgi:phosphoribosylglycinamide formyltransferase-1